MELSILDACGLPDGSILSVRSGPTRRQSPLPCTAPFRLPAGPWPLRIDVLALLGKSQHGASLAKQDADGCCRVPLEARDGRQMSVTLQVYDGKNGRPKTTALKANKDVDEPDAEAGPNSPVRRRDTEAEARAYLDRHRLHEFMHALFELLLRERPADPYAFIAERFRQAALMETSNSPDPRAIEVPAKVPLPLTMGSGTPDVLRSSVSTAPTLHHREISSPMATEGNVQVTVRTLRGRSLARYVTPFDDKVKYVKQWLESALGVPSASQQLFWWAETLPNETTLQDHGVPAVASIHIAYATRDPRLKVTLSGSSDGGLRLFSLENGELIRDFGDCGRQIVLAVDVDWSTMCAVTGSYNGRLSTWDLREGGGCTGVMEGHTEEVHTIVADWPSMRAISGAGDASARLWDLDAKVCMRVYQAAATVFSLAVDWDKMRLFGGQRNGLVKVWDVKTGSMMCDLDCGAAAAAAASTAVSATSVDVNGRAVSGFEDGHLAYWHFRIPEPGERSTENLPLTKVLLAHYSAVRTIASKWSDTDCRALCGSDDGSLSLWRLNSNECLARFARHIGFVWTIYADWARERALSGAFDGCIKLWDLRTGECLRTTQAHSRPVRSVAGGCAS